MAVLQQRLVPTAGKDGGTEPYLPAYGTGDGGTRAGVVWRCFGLLARSAHHAERIGARASASDGLCIVEVSASGVSISSPEAAGAAGKALAGRLGVRPIRAAQALVVPAADLAGAQLLGAIGVDIVCGASGQGKADSKWSGVWRPVLAAGGWEFEEHHTLREFHATELVAEHADPARHWCVVPVGGDGIINERRFMVLSGEWALPADLDLESESLRCLGAQRFVAAALLRLVCLRRYRGTISFVRARGPGLEALQRAATGPAPGGAAAAVPAPLAWMADEGAAVAAGDALAAAAAAAEAGSVGSSPPSGAPLRHLRPFAAASGGGGALAAASGGGGASKAGDASAADGGEWETWEGEWTYLWSMQLPHQSWDVSSVPFARPGDGIVWLALMRGRDEASCCATTCALLDLDGVGSASRHDCLHLIPCAAFKVDPELPPWTRNVALDGERVPYGPFQCEVHRGLARILA
ncbi:hypothetical protein FNF27_06555 [Cafeteria roenbergensis]|uniref:DAGKc domain-containing protein n=1 Tax=Cafeteria roenbergensis TaxID=33653 RepID=A0A5A8E1H3_CAFRO|nr:hypothetical protein FNF27_06555 [Cafeteria roenbergensis]